MIKDKSFLKVALVVSSSVITISTFSLIYFTSDNTFNIFSRRFNSSKQVEKICTPLQISINNLIIHQEDQWSITVLNQKSEIITEINGSIPRIPASNQKLFTTAYALDVLGPNHQLKTSLFKNSKGYYEIVGQGDPDLNNQIVDKIALKIKLNPFYTYSSNKIYLYEEPTINWWNKTWSTEDNRMSYGAPITRLAIGSNTEEYAVTDPINRFSKKLNKSLLNKGIKSNIYTTSQTKFDKRDYRTSIYNNYSAPLYMLLNLANSESHNFTSEVLLRTASGTWEGDLGAARLLKWINKKGINISKTKVFDGSGLSRKNRTTTRTLANTLFFMKNHKYSDYYISSMSLLGVRGTLKNNYIANVTWAKFLGKSGTLTGVRSLSGYLYNEDGARVISIIFNGDNLQESIFTDMLTRIYLITNC